ncbi:MAG: FkbM family methyltransferase [Chitinophagaceae bacterium]|nr:FkbM family methyltransferase [Chitinophagaceae bacterium]
MREFFKRQLLRVFDPIAFRLGYRKKADLKNNLINNTTENQYEKNNLLDNLFGLLKSIPFEPNHIVDVGANHGTWTREVLRFFPDSHYTLLEPQTWMKDSVKDLLDSNPRITFNAVGAGKEPGVFTFTIVDRDDSCSFRISKKEAEERNLKQVDVVVVTLNEFIVEKNLPVPEIIKIDAEGWDLNVLSGASNFFGKTEIFMVEAAIMNKKITNTLLEVISFMDKNGYRIFDFTDMNRPFKPSVLWLVEVVFVKKNGIIDSHNWVTNK